MADFNQTQLLRMARHAGECRYVGAGGVLSSFRMEQEVSTKRVRTIRQIKCAGCGYSLDYPCHDINTRTTYHVTT